MRAAKAFALLGWLIFSSSAFAAQQPNIGPQPEYADVASKLRSFIQRQMTDKHLPALSVALVDDRQIIWAEGFGFGDPKKTTPATAATVYRIGSVSKLFTDIAVMQLM